MLLRSAKRSCLKGLGDEDCQAPRDEEGDRCEGASLGRDHAPHTVDGIEFRWIPEVAVA
jgi:hypothetical protein